MENLPLANRVFKTFVPKHRAYQQIQAALKPTETALLCTYKPIGNLQAGPPLLLLRTDSFERAKTLQENLLKEPEYFLLPAVLAKVNETQVPVLILPKQAELPV